MDRDQLVRVPPWGIVIGYKLRRALLAIAGVVLALAAFQIVMALIWAITGVGNY